MADISGYTRIIKNADRGEHVRDAIVSALDAMNEIGGNAATLEGHPASYFAPQELFNVLEDQVGLVSDVLIAIENGLNALKFDMGPQTLSTSGGSFTIDCSGVRGADNLSTENFYFIINGATSASGSGSWQPTAAYDKTTFQYTYTWGAMSADVTVEVWIIKPAKFGNDMAKSPLDVTENGTYDPGAWGSYGPVRVNVPNALTAVELLATANGEYRPAVGRSYKKVTVNVPTTVKPKKITANGVYFANQDNVTGYDRVEVTIPEQIIGDHKEIRQNGLYKAKLEDNIDGYAEVLVNVSTSRKPIYLGTTWDKNTTTPTDSANGAHIAFNDTDNDWSNFSSVIFARDKSNAEAHITLNGDIGTSTMIFVTARDTLDIGATESDESLIAEMYADANNHRIFGARSFNNEEIPVTLPSTGSFIYILVASGATSASDTTYDHTKNGSCDIDISIQ